jgi:hypothetical protein
MHMHMRDHDKCQSYMLLTKYIWHAYNWWQITLIPVVSSSDLTYKTWLAYLQKSIIYIWHTSPLIPQVTPAHLMLHGQCCICYENVFTSWVRDHKTSLGAHILDARSWLVAQRTHNPYHMIGTVLKQNSSWGDGFGNHITRREDAYLLTLS